MQWLTRHWQQKTLVSHACLPLSWLFCLMVGLRRQSYRWGLRHVSTLPVPVIIVGNITVGGTGKTPLVIWLANWLSDQGYRPGIVTRGYGGNLKKWPTIVKPQAYAAVVGDEPLLLATHCRAPVVVDPNRPRGARYLIDRRQCNIIVCDDGMQHYALGRDIEIAVIDGQRRLGNGRLLPAGPLRERAGRLQSVDIIVSNGPARSGEIAMSLQVVGLVGLSDKSDNICDPKDFPTKKVHGVAGIGHPERFFALLTQLGFDVIRHRFPDHHRYKPEDLEFDDPYPIIMTEKDAVKYQAFTDIISESPGHFWYLGITAEPDSRLSIEVTRLLKEKKRG